MSGSSPPKSVKTIPSGLCDHQLNRYKTLYNPSFHPAFSQAKAKTNIGTSNRHYNRHSSLIMSRINIPLEALTSRLNLGSRFEGVRSQSLTSRFANLKPISEFLDLKRLSKPANFGEVQSRVNYNLSYFSSNYFAVALMLTIYSLLTNIALLFDMVFMGVGLFAIKKLDGRELELGFARLTTSQLYTGLFIIGVPVFIWASPIATALWLVGAIGVTTLGHASFMDKPIDTAFSEEAV